jgi:hypothetical protein
VSFSAACEAAPFQNIAWKRVFSTLKKPKALLQTIPGQAVEVSAHENHNQDPEQ